MNKAYSIISIKSVQENKEFVTVEGIASTPTVDRDRDIVRPEGAQFKTPMPLLWQHDHRQPVGQMTFAKPQKTGIPFKAKIPIIKEAGKLKDRIDEAIHSLKYKLVGAVSIGFRVLQHEIMESGGWDIKQWEWMELSLVTIPANPQAIITGVKSIDNVLRAAPGKSNTKNYTGVSDKPKFNGGIMKKLYEKLAALNGDRDTKTARLQELADLKKAEDRGYTNEETIEINEILAEVKTIDDDIMETNMEIAQAKTAVPVSAKSQHDASKSRGPEIFVPKFKDPDDKFKGQGFTRMVIAKALGRLEDRSPLAIAKERWGKTNPMLVEIIKADVEGGGSGSGEWGAELVQIDQQFTGDFIEYLYSRTVYDRLPLRQVPANVMIKGQDGYATGYWVGESAAIPVTTDDFSSVNLTPLKVAALAVVSNELLRDSSPAAEMLVRDALVEASSQRVDATFLSATAASAGVSPAGLLNGVSAVTSAGTDGDGVRADVKALYDVFITAKNASGLSFVMNPALAKAIQLMVNTLGLAEFPGINQNGGTLLGDNVVTGDNVNGSHLILLKPSDIYKIGDSGVQVSVSREAMIEMADNPAMNSQTPAAATGKTVSMFQTESTAIKVVRSINFQKRRSGAVQYVDDAAYGSTAS